MVRVGLDWRDLASTYVLCPSDSLVPNLESGGVGMCWNVRHEPCWLVGGLECQR